ncbi:MAG: ADOP family duplicated permease [Opitutales bacterium]
MWRHFLTISIRQLRASPGFTLLATLVLGIGISLVITLASVVNAVYFKTLPYPDSHRLIHLEVDNETLGYRGLGVTEADYRDWRAGNAVFEDLAAYLPGRTMLLQVGNSAPVSLTGVPIEPHTIRLLEVEPAFGDAFEPGGDAAPGVLISHRVWVEILQRTPQAPGTGILLNGEPVRVTGVMPPGFGFPSDADLWTPLTLQADNPEPTRWGNLQVVGRLKAGISLDTARVALAAIGSDLQRQRPLYNQGVVPVLKLFNQEYTEGPLQQTALVLFLAVLLVLGIACANVANLMVARSAGQVRSFAIRLASGARRWHLVAQVMTGSLVLSFLGTAAGLCISLWGIDLINWAIRQSGSVPFWLVFELDGRVVAFICLITVLTALAAGSLPAWRLSRLEVGPLIKENAPNVAAAGLGRVSRWLVVTQFALAFALILGAVLMVSSFIRIQERESVFLKERVLTARLPLEETGLPGRAARLRVLFALLDGLNREPAIERAALTTHPPGTGSGFTYFAVEGRTYPAQDHFPFCRAAWVSSGFFEAFDVRPLRGRTFRPQDRAIGEPLAVINDSLARRLIAEGVDPVVGHRLKAHSGEPGWETTPWIRIIGIVPDLGMQGLGTLDNAAGLYLNYSQGASGSLHLLLRPKNPGEAADLAGPLQRVFAGLGSDLPVPPLEPLAAILSEQLALHRVLGQVFSVFGIVATLLAGLGLYTVVRHTVEARRHEIGIRMSLGADGGSIRNHVLRLVGTQISIGLSLGVLLALGLGLALRPVLTGVSPTNPVLFILVALFLTLVGLAAGWQPARRAARIEPSQALRLG